MIMRRSSSNPVDDTLGVAMSRIIWLTVRFMIASPAGRDKLKAAIQLLVQHEGLGLGPPIQAKRLLLKSPTEGWMNACHQPTWVSGGCALCEAPLKAEGAGKALILPASGATCP